MQLMIALLVISAVLSFGAFLFVSIKRDSQRTGHISLAILSMFIYIVGGIFEATADGYFSAYRSIILEYLGLPFIAPHAFLALSDVYGHKINTHIRRSLFVLPFFCTIVVATGNINNLFYGSTAFFPGPPLARLQVTPTPLYILSVSYTLALLLCTQGLILMQIKKEQGRGHLREILLLIAVALPIISNLLYLFAFTPHGLDITPIVLAISSGLVAYAAQRLNLLQLLPLTKSTIMEQMTDAFIIVDYHGRFLDANRAAKEIYPLLRTVKVGAPFNELEGFGTPHFIPRDTDTDFPPVQAANGRYYHVSQTGIMQNGRTACTCIMLFDITETKCLIDVLDKKAAYDALTQVYNRGAFFQMAGREFAAIAQQGGQSAVLMLDLDHFKKVNDTYGHQCGDVVLQTAAQRLHKRLRETDIFGRYGGEEFCAFLMHISAGSAVSLANELCSSIAAEPFVCGGHSIPVTISIGVGAYDAAIHDTLEAMIGSADAALYTAKNSGRNRVVLFQKEDAIE